VTVRAEHPKILDPVIISDAVDVIDLNGDGLTPPFVDATPAATIF
jgi:hypothetical protein